MCADRPDVNLLDPEFHRGDPHSAYTWMRSNEPVYRDEANGLWAVSRHADLLAVERDSATFVSGRGYRSWWAPEENNIISSDDPEHLRNRRLVSNRFTPRASREHEPWLRATIDELLDCIGADGELEVVSGLAAPLPSRLIARLLGFPEERWPDVQRWSESIMRFDAASYDVDALYGLSAAISEFVELLGEVVPERRGCPVDDLVSVWVHADMGDRVGYSDRRMLHETGLFIAGGAETTRTAISHGLRVFADHPDQWDRVAADPSLVPGAVEEVIRWVTPLNNFFRTAAQDARIGEQAVAEGDRVILLYPSANRDEAVFDDPFRFDVTRTSNPHLAFGHGTHFCIGANLARFELQLLFGELTRRFRAPVVLTEPDVEANIFARAVRSFRVRLEPR
ncbi:MAG: cytochrome P450 [Actinomycetota bacterium]|nr:cytochrome P450 [Actinomycetota bacterium]